MDADRVSSVRPDVSRFPLDPCALEPLEMDDIRRPKRNPPPPAIEAHEKRKKTGWQLREKSTGKDKKKKRRQHRARAHGPWEAGDDVTCEHWRN